MIFLKYDYDVVVIGAGSGGLVAASIASSMQARVMLVESSKMGGDCLNYGCVPSKSFLKSAHVSKEIRNSEEYGIHVGDVEVSLPRVLARVQEVIKSIEPHDSVERYTSKGVVVVTGVGKIMDQHTVSVEGTRYTTKRIIIATGCSPFVPNIEGLHDVSYYTNETIFSIDYTPKEMIVLGAGVIGLELGQGFCNLGVNVTIVDFASSIFSRDENEVGTIMKEAIENDGVNFSLESKIIKIEEKDNLKYVTIEKNGVQSILTCDTLLVALGRKPNSNFGADNVGVQVDKRGYVITDDYLETSVKGIYAIGDITGKYQFTHMASYQASIAVKNALVFKRFKVSYNNVAWTTFTSPEVSHVGVLEEDIKKQGINYKVYCSDIFENDRSKTKGDTIGFVKIIVDKKGIVIGATIVGSVAGEMLALLSYMVSNKQPLSKVMNVIYQYPIQGEIIKTLSVKAFVENVKPWQNKVMKKIATRGG